MKRNNVTVCASSSVVLVLLLVAGIHQFGLTGTAVAQAPQADTAPVATNVVSAPAPLSRADNVPDRDVRHLANVVAEMSRRLEQPFQQRMDAALQNLRDAKNDDGARAAKAELRQVLTDVFAEDMQEREKQAQEIEARLAKLRAQYEERQKVKDEIIELQLKVLEKEAQGLGFPRGGVTAITPYRSGARGRGLPRSGPYDPLNAPAPRTDQRDPRPRERTLADLKESDADNVEDLRKRGHFVESPDGKYYAYVNANYPAGPSYLQVVDAATGRLIASRYSNTLIGPLEFTDEGVATREHDGTLKLRVDITKERNTQDAPATSAPTIPSIPDQAPATYNTAVAEFTQLRDRYEQARNTLHWAERQLERKLAQPALKPDATADEIYERRSNTMSWERVEQARRDCEESKRVLDVKMKLLDLDLQAATIARDRAASVLATYSEMIKRSPNSVSKYEVDKQRAEVDTATLNVERAKTLYELFKSISDAGAAGSDSKPSEDRGEETKDAGQQR